MVYPSSNENMPAVPFWEGSVSLTKEFGTLWSCGFPQPLPFVGYHKRIFIF
jgi:hypothetical protein